MSLLVISNLFKIDSIKDEFEISNGDFMNQKEFFSKFELLKNLKEEKKNQLYKHFSTAPDWVIDSCSVEKIKPNTVNINPKIINNHNIEKHIAYGIINETASVKVITSFFLLL